ncbi:YlbE-like family protein [Mesobacillus foraminis]|uniref:YlbE-like family protein n=1 Tax=Mesobacillus foraminis TaxID=279826 RepID=UPI001BEC153E|nr:YlbE-like family protein [Mesobacillus foraminis]MBT2756136.1 YlbE-like family protein [Mesobacillus foraminis]
MRKDVLDLIQKRKDLLEFIRVQPHWYRKLSRDPGEITKLEIAALHYYEKTIPHQVQKFSNGIQMASMMLHMFSTMNSSSNQ